MNIKDLMVKEAMIMDLQATDKKARSMKWSKKCLMPAGFPISTHIKKEF